MNNIKRVVFLLAISMALPGCGLLEEKVVDNVQNSPPIADAGTDQEAMVGSLVTLDASNSSDSEGDSITYNWSITSKPDNSNSTLSDSVFVSPVFIPDVEGEYEISLNVNDGKVGSNTDTVMISATVTVNTAPVVDAGEDRDVSTGAKVILENSTCKDGDNDPLSYKWSFTSIPQGSSVILSDPLSEQPEFTPDIDGTYEISLTCNDGKGDASADTVLIDACTGVPVNLPAMDPGIYAIIVMEQIIDCGTVEDPKPCLTDKDGKLYRAMEKDYVKGIALRINWRDIEPEQGVFNTTMIPDTLAAIKTISEELNRTPPSVFLKFYPTTMPAWVTENEETEKEILNAIKIPTGDSKNPTVTEKFYRLTIPSIGIKLVRPQNESGLPEYNKQDRYYPVSTDEAYIGYLKDTLLTFLSNQLNQVDPDAVMIPMISITGPSMTDSHTMRVTHKYYFPRGDYPPGDTKSDKLGLGWTFKGHLEAWEDMFGFYATLPGFKNRIWVFNLTQEPPSWKGIYGLLTSEQERVAKVAEEVHPLGSEAVWFKSESWTARFKNKCFVTDMLEQFEKTPYSFVAQAPYRHGWESWGSHWKGRDSERWALLYPHDDLSRNALFLDPREPGPMELQRTQWVEFWIPDILHDYTLDPCTYEKLEDYFRNLDRTIRRYADCHYELSDGDPDGWDWTEHPATCEDPDASCKPLPSDKQP